MKNSIIALFFVFSLIMNVSGQGTVNEPPLTNAMDSLSYGFGLLIGNNLSVQGVKGVNQDLFINGFNKGYTNQETSLTIEAANKIVQDYFNKQVADESAMNLQKSAEFLAENQKKEGIVTLPDGLQYKVITSGAGTPPIATDQVKVNYKGTFIDGKVFDSSYDRNEPIVFGVDQVIPGWTEALQLMQPGAKWMLFVPPALAYGEKGAGGVIGPNQALIFEVELIEVNPK
jgi:FKBP-type peptidyl-prolyl cis-trans isomerase FklB